jgi:hypothetical protein
MPLYDYLCESNGRTIEIRHSMTESIETWGELCRHSGQALGDTPADTPVRKLIGSGNALNGPDTLAKADQPRDCATAMPMRDHKY